jgi:hypothetical protein
MAASSATPKVSAVPAVIPNRGPVILDNLTTTYPTAKINIISKPVAHHLSIRRLSWHCSPALGSPKSLQRHMDVPWRIPKRRWIMQNHDVAHGLRLSLDAPAVARIMLLLMKLVGS